MRDPKGITVKSITTARASRSCGSAGRNMSAFQGKKLCFLDDVVSTGGTIDAVLELAEARSALRFPSSPAP